MTDPKPRYLVCPGHVISKTDGDRHYISAQQLIQLYGVRRQDCVIRLERPSWWPQSQCDRQDRLEAGMIKLTPRHSGDYTLPTS